MAEPKTRPTDADVGAFLESAVTPRRREEGPRIDAIFREVTGEDPVMWGPTMVGYGSVAVGGTTWFRTGFSPRKAQLTFYGLTDAPESAALLQRLGPHTEGTACVYAKKLDDLDLDVLRALVRTAWAHTAS